MCNLVVLRYIIGWWLTFRKTRAQSDPFSRFAAHAHLALVLSRPLGNDDRTRKMVPQQLETGTGRQSFATRKTKLLAAPYQHFP